MDFTVISPRKINTDIFINKDSLTSKELDTLISKGAVQVFTPEQITKFVKDAEADIQKSEDAETKSEYYKNQINSLQKHQVDGKVIYLKIIEKSLSTDIEKGETGEDLFEEISEDVLEKGHVAEAFRYGSLRDLQFAKKGSVVKSELAKTVEKYNEKLLEMKTKMNNIISKSRFQPTQNPSDYMLGGLKTKITGYKLYEYGCTIYTDQTSVNSEKSPYYYSELSNKDMVPESKEEALLCNVYNQLCRACLELEVDKGYLEIFKDNLDDNTSYKFNIQQLAEMGIEKGEDNDFEKGGEGSRGGHIIGHTKAGNPIYGQPASKVAKKEGGSNPKSDGTAKVHKDNFRGGQNAIANIKAAAAKRDQDSKSEKTKDTKGSNEFEKLKKEGKIPPQSKNENYSKHTYSSNEDSFNEQVSRARKAYEAAKESGDKKKLEAAKSFLDGAKEHQKTTFDKKDSSKKESTDSTFESSGKTYKTKTFNSVKEANEYLKDHKDSGVIGEKGGKVHVAKNADKGENKK